MHYSWAHFFLLILVSFNQLAKPQARKLNSNGLSFAVELIHRDSLHSSHYNSSIRENYLGSKYYSNKENNINSDLISNGGDYLMKIAIGTPPVEFLANADTGSDLVWVQCTPCEPCIAPESPLFDPTKSSTYQAIPCDSQSCSSTDLSVSGCLQNDSTNCAYKYGYGDGTETIGNLATDTISFTSADGTSIPFPTSTFGCGHQQQGSFGIKGNGIIGLGFGPLSLVSQLGPKINYKFSYCLAPLTSGVNSKLRFGADVDGPGVVSTPFTIQDPPTNYYLTLDGITIGGDTVDVGQAVIIDSGTTMTYLETSVYNGVRTAISSAIGLSPVADPDNSYDLCYQVQQSGGDFNPPDVVFHFKGADVKLKADNIFRQIQDDLVCLAMMPAKDSSIFGNIAQVNFEVGYDLQAKKVSFAPADCTKY